MTSILSATSCQWDLATTVERGERNASFESIDKLLNALGVSWTEFGRMVDGMT
jgi:hypothetical protein